ncbi:MAG: hypothetical protein HGA67_03290 [Candidatus Yonathbacteria bacterium]|nr:hypothetical protein [Candidatus Yonathbacteria bacterium]
MCEKKSVKKKKALHVIFRVPCVEDGDSVRKKIDEFHRLGVDIIFLCPGEDHPSSEDTCALSLVAKSFSSGKIGIVNIDAPPLDVLNCVGEGVAAVYSDWGGVTSRGSCDEGIKSFLAKKDRPVYFGGVSRDNGVERLQSGYALFIVARGAGNAPFDNIVLGALGHPPSLNDVRTVHISQENSPVPPVPVFVVCAFDEVSIRTFLPLVDGFIVTGCEHPEAIVPLVELLEEYAC